MSFLAPQALWLLALLPVVVALHFMRARRRRYEVSALFLWRRAQSAVARRRRFSPTWLLAAQLLFVALAAVALARPVPAGGDRPDRVLIVDASASMAAVGGAGTEGSGTAGTRLEQAQREARGLIAGAGRVALVRAGLDARLVAPLDASAADLQTALEELRAGDAAADLLRALELAGTLLPGAEVHVFTDQAAGLGAATLHRVGAPAENVGISAFDIGVGQAFVAVVASGARPAQVEVELRQGDTQLARGTVLVPSGGSGSTTFPLAEVSGVVEARLLPPPGDALALDDVAYAGSRGLTVVSQSNYDPLLRALAAVPLTEVGVARDAAFRPADLRVVERATADGLPPGNYLLFAPPTAQPDYRLISDWERADALMRFVDLRDVVVGLPADAEPWADAPGWRVLARTADLTPVVRLRQNDDGIVLQFAFHPSQSDIVLRPAFPALIANLLGRLDSTTRLRLGEALPSGQTVLQPGVYADGAALASLLAAGESRLPETAAVSGALDSAVAATTAGAAADAGQPNRATAAGGAPSGLALALLVAAAAALLAEWLLFSSGKGRRLVG